MYVFLNTEFLILQLNIDKFRLYCIVALAVVLDAE